ncbi:MAG TPA: hypothetical protein VKV17_06730 [Bryobacteraceae bacterium]|nr:hypothetical protein [Bryobacteraceae bacterium]
MKTTTRLATFAVALTLSLPLFAQGSSTGSLGMGGITSSYSLGNTTFNSVQYAITISIDYNSGATAANYISPAQLTSDYQGFLNAYPNPGDPPEAILLSVAQSFAQKYSQFDLVSLDAFAGSATALQAEIEASAGNLQVGTLDRKPKQHKR